MARDPQNLHGPALLSQCPQGAPQHPQSSLFALSLSVTRAKPPVSSCRASYHAASVAATVSASKDLYLAAAVAAHYKHSWSPLFSTTTPAPLSVCSPDTLASKIHKILFRLLSARCSRGISTKGSKTFWHLCLQLSLFVPASPPSRQPLSCSLPCQPPPSIIQA